MYTIYSPLLKPTLNQAMGKGSGDCNFQFSLVLPYCTIMGVTAIYYPRGRSDSITISTIKKWIVAALVFLSLLRILYYLLSKVVFEYITFSDPYNNIFQMIAMGIMLIVALVCTSLLINDKNND
ncbi:hypothetical protein R50912_25055 [Paenibacillus sp. FSL R5-0912]|nr:hypothetical protein R50912_25055 [Paenibacillus sp. FSL R5-0912]